MTVPLLGARVRLRIYVPGDQLSEVVMGTIAPGQSDSTHESYIVKLDRIVRIYEDEFAEICFIPQRKSIADKREDRLLEILQRPVHGTVSWKSTDGSWTSLGDRGTFAEVTLIQLAVP